MREMVESGMGDHKRGLSGEDSSTRFFVPEREALNGTRKGKKREKALLVPKTAQDQKMCWTRNWD